MPKGITPVVSVILLLLITVAIVGFASGFFQRVFTASAQQTQQETERITESIGQTFRIENAKDTSIALRNTGSSALNTTTLSVYVDDVMKACTWSDATIAAGAIGTCILAPADDCTGQRVRVVGASGEDSVACN